MPGLFGLITKMPRAAAEEQLRGMLAAGQHEPDYSTGTCADESAGLYIGWVARKGSFAGRMPAVNETGSMAVFFAGEDYPEPGLRSVLRQKGHNLGDGAAAYLVHQWEEDPTFPLALNGRFHGVMLDRSSQSITLFNDRYGMDRVYYHESRDAFYFAAEAKALLKIRPELRRIDHVALGEFIGCGCVLENKTLFKGIGVLPPASAWKFRTGTLEEKSSYFNPREWEEQPQLSQEEYYDRLRDVFSTNLPRYFAGDQRIAMSITGGLDTRMIMAWHHHEPGNLPCYSFGGTYRESQDVIVGRKVAQVCGQPYEVITVGSEFLGRFPHYAERTVFLSDGCADVSRSSDLYINEIAARIAPVRMTGNYGGEVLRPAPGFKPSRPAAGLFSGDTLSAVDASFQTYSTIVQTHPVAFAVFRQAPWHHYGLLSLEQTQLMVRSPYLDNDVVRTAFQMPRPGGDVSERLIRDGNPELAKIRTDRGLAGEQNSMIAALRRNFLEFTFKAEYAYDYGMPQSVARIDNALKKLHLERMFLGRHKFYHFRVWYRDKIANYVRDMLLDQRSLSRPYLERTGVEAIVHGHTRGGQNHTRAIHKLLTLELIHRLFIDSAN